MFVSMYVCVCVLYVRFLCVYACVCIPVYSLTQWPDSHIRNGNVSDYSMCRKGLIFGLQNEDRNDDGGGIASRSLLTNFYSFPVSTCINSTYLPTLESYFSTDVCSMPPSMDTVSTAREMITTPNSLTPLDTSEVVPLNDKLLVEKEEERVIREVCSNVFF